MIGLPVDWVEETEAARVAEMLAEYPLAMEDSMRDALVVFHMICLLEVRELRIDDLYMELLCGEPLDYGMFGEFGSTLRSDWCSIDIDFRSTLGDCMLRRAASIGRVESAALLLGHGARLDSELEDWGCLATPLVNACVAGH